jgi:hypothetical protein
MSESGEDFDSDLAAVERFIAEVQQGAVPTGEAMRAYRDIHRPAIDRLRAQLAAFEALLVEAGVRPDEVSATQPPTAAPGEDADADASGSA